MYTRRDGSEVPRHLTHRRNPELDTNGSPSPEGDEPPVEQQALPVIGLSVDDVEHLKVERKEMLADLAATSPGRELIRRSDQQVDRCGHGLADDIRALARTARGDSTEWQPISPTAVTPPNLMASQSAAVVLNELVAVCHQELNHDITAKRSSMYRWAQDTHRRIDSRIRFDRRETPAPHQRLLARYWGVLANVFTASAATAVFLGPWYGWAAALVLARILVTTMVWAMAAYPADRSPNHPVLESDTRVCTLGHAGDMLLFLSFAGAQAQQGYLDTAFAVALAAWFMIFGTLLRIAATSNGLSIPRLHLERVVRGGSTLAAFFLAAWAANSDGDVSRWWAPMVMITLPSIFAFIEGQESWRALSFKPTFGPSAPPSTPAPTPATATA